MRAIGLTRQIAAGELVRSLGPCLDTGKPVLNGEVDRLVIADLEMQERVVLDAAPITAIERVGADEVERAGDVAPRALSEHEQHLVGHAVTQQAETFAREIGRAPFARAGVHIKGEERIEMGFGQLTPGHPFYRDAGGQRLAPLLTHGLTLARGERAEKFVEARIALVLPVELLIGAFEEAEFAAELPFLLGEKGDVQAGDAEPGADLHSRLEQERLALAFALAGTHQQAPARDGSERDRDLELRIIVAAGACIGVGPAMVEHVFALRVRFEVAGYD